MGNVDNAQRTYLQTIKNLRDGRMRQIPYPLYHGLKVLHFLKIGKLHSSLGNNEMAARLLKTVLNHYEDFPQRKIHTFPQLELLNNENIFISEFLNIIKIHPNLILL